MSESNEMRNRYMVIDVPEEWKLEQHPTSNRQAPDNFSPFLSLINTLGEQESSIKEKLTDMGLKDR